MADVIVPITTGVLPEGFCPATWQETAQGFGDIYTVTLPSDFGQIIISETTPAPEDNNKIWFKTDANGKVTGIYSYSTLVGDWVLVGDIPYYFQDIGVDSALEITTGEGITALSDLTGRFLFINVANANTTNSVTLKVDTTAPATIKKFGGSQLESGDLSVGQVMGVIFDGTDYQMFTAIPASVNTPVFATSNAVIVGNTDIAFTKASTGTWDSIDLDAVVHFDDNTLVSTVSAALEWRTGSLVGVALTVSASEGASNIAQTFTLNDDDDAIVAKWAYTGLVPSAISSTDTITVRITVSETAAATLVSGSLIGKAVYS